MRIGKKSTVIKKKGFMEQNHDLVVEAVYVNCGKCGIFALACFVNLQK